MTSTPQKRETSLTPRAPQEHGAWVQASKSTGDFLRSIILLGSIANTPQEWRESFKLVVSGVLALGLWGFLGWVAAFQLNSVTELSKQGANLAGQNGNQNAQIEKAIANVNDTAKTLYALLTPLATAVTGYFFAASSQGQSSQTVVNEGGSIAARRLESSDSESSNDSV